MVTPRVLTLAFVLALLAPVLADHPAGAQEAADVLATDIYPGACGDDFGDPAASLTEADLPVGEAEGAPDARPVATSFTTVPLSLEDLLAEAHVVATVGEDQEIAACGAIGGLRTEAGAIVIELSEEGDSGISGVAYLAPSGAGPGQTDISLFLAGLEPTQPAPPAEPAATPTTESTAEVGQGATIEAMTEPDAAPTEVTVEITIFEFDPDPVVIATGGTVTWVNRDPMAAHSVSVVSPDGVETRSDVLRPDGRYSQTFTEPGTYTVSDFINPMVQEGTVIVEPAGEATGATTTETNQDASAEPTEEPTAEVAAATETYVSPSFGYSLSYDPTIWEVIEEPYTDADGVDWIGLQEQTGFSSVYFGGIPINSGALDAQDCTQAMTTGQTSEDDVVQYEELYLDDDGTQLTGGDASDAFATTIITRTMESGGTGEQAFYTRCIVLPSGTGILAIQHFAAEIIYDSAAVAREQLLEGLTLP